MHCYVLLQPVFDYWEVREFMVLNIPPEYVTAICVVCVHRNSVCKVTKRHDIWGTAMDGQFRCGVCISMSAGRPPPLKTNTVIIYCNMCQSFCNVCLQKFIDQLHSCRFAAHWLRRNSRHFKAVIDIPPSVDRDDEDLCSALDMAAPYEQLRDLTLINFADPQDLKLFMRLVGEGLGVAACVCLNGSDFMENNTCDLWL